MCNQLLCDVPVNVILIEFKADKGMILVMIHHWVISKACSNAMVPKKLVCYYISLKASSGVGTFNSHLQWLGTCFLLSAHWIFQAESSPPYRTSSTETPLRRRDRRARPCCITWWPGLIELLCFVLFVVSVHEVGHEYDQLSSKGP